MKYPDDCKSENADGALPLTPQYGNTSDLDQSLAIVIIAVFYILLHRGINFTNIQYANYKYPLQVASTLCSKYRDYDVVTIIGNVFRFGISLL